MAGRNKSKAAYRRLAYMAAHECFELCMSTKASDAEVEFWSAIEDLIRSRYAGIERASDGMTYNAAVSLFSWGEPVRGLTASRGGAL